MIKYLEQLKLEIDEISLNITKINKFQQKLGFEVTNFHPINTIETRFLSIERLWQSRSDYQDFMLSQSEIHFLNLDFQQIEIFTSQMKSM